MQKKTARVVLPAALIALVALTCAPAFAQIRIGVELPSIHIRVAPDAPPPLRYERRMERPSSGHVWIAGYWDRQDDRWAWAPGRWEEPGRRGSSWVRPRYEREGDAYRYEPGHWSHQRLVESEDYSRWHREHDNGRGHGNGNGHGNDKEHQKHGGNEHEHDR